MLWSNNPTHLIELFMQMLQDFEKLLLAIIRTSERVTIEMIGFITFVRGAIRAKTVILTGERALFDAQRTTSAKPYGYWPEYDGLI